MSKNQKTPKKRFYRVDKELWALLIKSMILLHAEAHRVRVSFFWFSNFIPQFSNASKPRILSIGLAKLQIPEISIWGEWNL